MSAGAASREATAPRFLPVLCVVLLAAAHVIASAAWMHRNGFFSPERPPYQDAGYWRSETLPMLRAWQQSGFTGWIQAGLDHDHPHPPLLSMLAALASAPEG